MPVGDCGDTHHERLCGLGLRRTDRISETQTVGQYPEADAVIGSVNPSCATALCHHPSWMTGGVEPKLTGESLP
ncbi:hypothetical protein [Neorhodopirellula pilleata]|uniref:hypothetical protein n=1 Tax=Neorhodopirellula pilleata TaxID=2714738 RepID=UPI0011B55A92|nr:hypothetical protein [Neorhodopirellula pilleata]